MSSGKPQRVLSSESTAPSSGQSIRADVDRVALGGTDSTEPATDSNVKPATKFQLGDYLPKMPEWNKVKKIFTPNWSNNVSPKEKKFPLDWNKWKGRYGESQHLIIFFYRCKCSISIIFFFSASCFKSK